MYVDVLQGGKGELWTPWSGGLNKIYPKAIYNMYSLISELLSAVLAQSLSHY